MSDKDYPQQKQANTNSDAVDRMAEGRGRVGVVCVCLGGGGEGGRDTNHMAGCINKPSDHGSRAGLKLTKPKKEPHFRVVRLTLVSCVCFGFTGQCVYVCVFIHD